MASTLFPHYCTEFFIFTYIFCCFNSYKTYYDVLLITYAWQTSLSYNWAYWHPLKAIEFDVCQDFTSIFSKIFFEHQPNDNLVSWTVSQSVMTWPFSFLLQPKFI